MSEMPIPIDMQTRQEHSRSLEDAERFRALDTLKEIGLLVSISDVETFHGRVGKVDQSVWEVDPCFANGGFDSDRVNINLRSTLYTGNAITAEQFAVGRGKNLIRRRLDNTFVDMVRGYNADQRQKWLGRLNEETAQRSKKSHESIVVGLKTGITELVTKAPEVNR
jgi:hypothetical protein